MARCAAGLVGLASGQLIGWTFQVREWPDPERVAWATGRIWCRPAADGRPRFGGAAARSATAAPCSCRGRAVLRPGCRDCYAAACATARALCRPILQAPQDDCRRPHPRATAYMVLACRADRGGDAVYSDPAMMWKRSHTTAGSLRQPGPGASGLLQRSCADITPWDGVHSAGLPGGSRAARDLCHLRMGAAWPSESHGLHAVP